MQVNDLTIIKETLERNITELEEEYFNRVGTWDYEFKESDTFKRASVLVQTIQSNKKTLEIIVKCYLED